MGLGEDIKSLFTDDFKEGARQTSEKPIIFIDPDKFKDPLQTVKNPLGFYSFTASPDDVQRMRDMLDKQHAGFSDDLSNSEVSDLVVSSLQSGPFALKVNKDGQDMCLINQPLAVIDSKNELMPALAKTTKEELGVIPGWDDHWMRSVGIHEGGHCNQPEIEVIGRTNDEISVQILQREVDADKDAQAWLKQNNQGEIADAMKDYRALGASDDAVHATSIFLAPGGPSVVTMDHYKAAKEFQDVMIESVADAQNISTEAAKDLFDTDRKSFVSIAQQQFESGAVAQMPQVQENPFIADYMQNYLGAYQRQVIDPDPVQKHAPLGPQHHHGFSRFSDASYNDNIDYITASISLERARSGEALDTVEEKDLKDILSSPETEPEVLSALQDNYPDEIQSYLPAAPALAPSYAPAQPAPQNPVMQPSL